MDISADELKKIIDDHILWLSDNGGSRANLSRANLSRANLSRANLSWANLSWANLSWANLSRANLSRANLEGANLSWANLSWANLSWANLDYSCWPLWCGSKGVVVDIKIIRQLLAHVCALSCKDKSFLKIRKSILLEAIKSHKAKDLGIITKAKK